MFAAPADPAGVIAARAAALERVQLLLADRQHTQQRLAEIEARMTGVLDELGLTRLVTSITGLSASAPQRSWPRPATHAASPPPAPWSNTPA
jgi:transposase